MYIQIGLIEELSLLGVMPTPALLYELDNICGIYITYLSDKEVTLPVSIINPGSTATSSSYNNGYPLYPILSFQLYYNAADTCSIRAGDIPIPK